MKSIKKILLFIIVIFAILPTTLTSQRLNVIAVRNNQKEGNISFVKHVSYMNQAMFHKILMDYYGKDKYYELLKDSRENHGKFRLIADMNQDSITNWGVFISKSGYKIHTLLQNLSSEDCENIYKVMGDSTIVNDLIKQIEQNLIFTIHDDYFYATFGFLEYVPTLLYALEYHDNDIDTLSKDEFLKLQTHRIDSILTKTHLRYSRFDSPQIYDTDEYPLFNDSVKPIICN